MRVESGPLDNLPLPTGHGTGQLGPDALRVGMAKILQDAQRVLPGCPGRVKVAGRAVGVAQMAKCLGLEVAVFELPEDVESVPVAVDREVVFTEVVVGVPERVPGVGFAGTLRQ